jgi:SWIM zinc finger
MIDGGATMPDPKLTEALIRNLTSAQSFSRGEEYFIAGAVSDLTLRGNSLRAQVEGSRYDPYQVVVELDAAGVIDATCTCPYDLGSYCKHIVAVLLAYIRQPDHVTERRPVAELLVPLGRDELADLLTKLLSEHAHLVDWVEAQLGAKTVSLGPKAADKSRPRHTPIDPSSFRRQAQNILGSLGRMRSSDAYWATSGVVLEVETVSSRSLKLVVGAMPC